MKRLVLCFDGTWNTLADPTAITNVVKIADLITLQDPKGVNQICYYNPGVGSGGPIDRITGGIFGAGLKNNVKRGLAFLTLNYDAGEPGKNNADEIYLFGFSRGAYTARAVAGVISAVGIPWEISKIGGALGELSQDREAAVQPARPEGGNSEVPKARG